jgi:hypothetical protein
VLLCVAAAAFVARAAPAGTREAKSHRQSSGRSQSLWAGLDRRCSALADGSPPYPWPLKPFDRQHPVRGYFGDPRTVLLGPHEGLFSFHNGVDIAGWPGNRVYSVSAGVVASVDGDEVVVSSPPRRFQYIHIHPWVHVGRHVIASLTILGTIFDPWDHVHLTEIDGDCVVNPLAVGHLEPYADHTIPRVLSISIRSATGRRLRAAHVSGYVRMVAAAQDEPALPASGVWRRMPVSPALVTWKLRSVDGRRVAQGIAADFLVSEPPTDQFCRVYAPGTIQNFAADDGSYHWGAAGRYRFELTPKPFDTARLANGRYLLTVTAADTTGNKGSASERIAIHNRGVPPRSAASTDWRCGERALTSGAG